MTVNTTKITSGPYVGNGIADTFSYTFRVVDKSQLSVYETTDAGALTLLTVDTDYTVAGIGDDQGGTITRVAGPLPANYQWYIRSNYQKTQLTAFQSQGAFFPDLHEDAMDQLTFLIQQLCDGIDRSPRLPDSYSGDIPLSLDEPVAGQMLRWKGDLSGLENVEFITDPAVIASGELLIFPNVASMKASTSTALVTGVNILTQGYFNPDDGGGSAYIVSGSVVVDEKGDHTLTNGNVALIQQTGVSSVRQFGAVGDGVADDTASISSALSHVEQLSGVTGDTYLLTGQIDVNNPVDFDLSGSTSDFQLTSSVAGYYVKSDNVTIRNGTITVNGTVMGGNGHALAPITIGKQSDGTGNKNFNFTDLTLSTNRNDAGASISVIGECTNGLIQNITIPDNPDCRNIIGCEWGGTPGGGTGHPHNIVIRNVKIGQLSYPSYGSAGYVYGVWLSAVFDVKIENLTMEKGHGLVMVTRGDNANTYAPSSYKDRVGTGISVENASIQSCYGYGVRVIGSHLSGTLDNIDCSTVFKNIYVKGGKVGGNNNFASAFEQCKNVLVENFKSEGLIAAGVTTGINVENLSLKDIEIRDSEIYGISVNNSIKTIIDGGLFVGNNSNGGAGVGTAVIVLGSSTDTSVSRCVFSEEGSVSETQKYCIYADGTTVRPRLNDNHVHALAAAGVGYLINISSTPNIDATGSNNTGDSSITNIVGGAPIFAIQGNNQKVARSGAIPTAGSWNVGDIIYHITPAAGGVIGWVCVTAGTPGTWKTFGSIAA